MNAINHADDGSVQLYHTRPDKEGTPQFECGGRVPAGQLRLDNGSIVADCPANCGTQTRWPLTGDPEAQRLHARHRHATRKNKTAKLEDAVESVLADVIAAGGDASLDLAREGIALLGDAPTAKHPQLRAAKQAFDRAREAAAEHERARREAEEHAAGRATISEVAPDDVAEALRALPDEAKRAVGRLLGLLLPAEGSAAR